MSETLKPQGDDILRRLELQHPGYSAAETNIDFVLTPVSRLNEAQQRTHRERLVAFKATQMMNK